MPSLNKVQLIGNLGADPEMRYNPNGSAMTTFSVATSRSWKKNEEWVEETEWHNIVVWGDRAERAAERLRKGNRVYVEGRLQTRSWQDEKYPDVKRYKTEIVADQVFGVEKREAQDQGQFETPAEGFGAPVTSAPKAASQPRGASEYDDLPF